ncbi:hypothetical protein WN73_14580 [Bradyrhizobium sp. CCBAU 45394]|nr:hypothetical protein [Bradyrhizobium sp. CCBAU 45394]
MSAAYRAVSVRDLQGEMLARCQTTTTVHYVSEATVSFSGSIHFGVVQPTKGYTARHRFAYQTCTWVTDRFGRVDYRRYADCRVGGGVLLPMGAPEAFENWEYFRSAAVCTEKRWDGQEGRIVDFSLPRAVPRMLLLPLAAFALLPFVERGMAVRLDVECVVASDGKLNPHAHGWLAQRTLEQHGFGLKEERWNTLFRRDQGRYARALLGGRLTLGCAVLGIDAYVDPRRNDAKGAGIPKARRPRRMVCASNEGREVEAIEQLVENPELKQKHEAPKQVPGPEDGGVIVTNAAVYSVDNKRASKLRMQFADAAQKAGYQLHARLGSPAVALRGSSVSFDGHAFRIAATGNSEDAAIVARFVRELDWPALVVEGGARLADLLAIAAASEGVFMVNRAPSTSARDLIAREFFGEMKAAIARHDPLGIAAEFFANFEADKVGTQADEALDAPRQVDVVCEDHPQQPANLVVPNAAPVQSSDVADPASAVAPIATRGTDSRRVAAGGDVRRTAASSSEAIARMSGHRREDPRPPRLGVASNNLPRSPADLRVPSTAPIEPSDVAEPASAVSPIATSGNESRRVAAGGHVRRTAASSSEAIARMSGHRKEAPRPPQVGVASNNLPRSPADLRVPRTAPLHLSRELAGLASAVAPIATPGTDSRRVAAGEDASRTAGSSSEAFEGLEPLPDDDSWMVKPDPITLARDARELEAGARRQRQYQEDFDEFLRRKIRQSSGLRRDGISSPGSARPRLPTRRPQPIPQWPTEISAASGDAVETEELDYQAPRP